MFLILLVDVAGLIFAVKAHRSEGVPITLPTSLSGARRMFTPRGQFVAAGSCGLVLVALLSTAYTAIAGDSIDRAIVRDCEKGAHYEINRRHIEIWGEDNWIQGCIQMQRQVREALEKQK